MSATISKEFVQAIKKKGLFNPDDFKKIAALTREHGLNKGRGYAPATIRHFLLDQFTTTVEVVDLITKYYEGKVNTLSDIKKRQSQIIAA